jgi:hypothetical protein
LDRGGIEMLEFVAGTLGCSGIAAVSRNGLWEELQAVNNNIDSMLNTIKCM